MSTLLLSDVKQVDLVDYLASLGHHPQKVSGTNYWYLSPLRNERTASFKVNRKLNLFYDFGTGQGGSIIDFGMLYHRCSIPELLEKLSESFSFHRSGLSTGPDGITPAPAGNKEHSNPGSGEKKIHIVGARPIVSPALLDYLHTRQIPVDLAQEYCREVTYTLHGKQYYAIGFKNDQGGYELRNPYFKGSSSPKGPSFFDNKAQEVSVVEGFFSFLSYLVVQQHQSLPSGNYLVLNSLSFIEKARPLIERHGTIHLFLDRDQAGIKCTEQAIKSNSRYRDGSLFYENEKDLNQWLIRNSSRLQYQRQSIKQSKELVRKMKFRDSNRKPGRHL